MQTHNGGQFCKTRQRNPTPDGFSLTLEEDGMDNNHNQETFGWVALPSTENDENGVLAGLHYQALNLQPVTDQPFDAPLAGAFRSAPAVFGSIASFNGGDPSALRRTETTTGSLQLFIEEETVRCRCICCPTCPDCMAVECCLTRVLTLPHAASAPTRSRSTPAKLSRCLS